MRWNIPVLCAAVMLAGFGAPSHAAEVRIGDFEFSCKSGGKTVKPKFGDIDGAYFGDMPGQYEACMETIQRKIAGCEMNTVFASNTEAERYPGCEQTFEEQGHACALFFHREKAKCDAYAPPDATQAALIAPFRFSCKAPDGATVKPKFGDIPGAYFLDMPAQRDQCIETVKRKIHGCSINTGFASNTEAERYPGCESIFEAQGSACAAFYQEEMAKCDIGGTAGETISQECPELDWGDEPPHTFTDCEGPVVDGKRHGHWVLRSEDGSTHEGPFVDGKPHGHWSERHADGDVYEGPAVDGKRHGDWVLRYADGDVYEGPAVDGKRHGDWVVRYADGSVWEGPYVDGKPHGTWRGRLADGSCRFNEWVEGEIVNSGDC